jgi:hypothetical protein
VAVCVVRLPAEFVVLVASDVKETRGVTESAARIEPAVFAEGPAEPREN